MTSGDALNLGELGLIVGLNVPEQEIDRILRNTQSRLGNKVQIDVGMNVGSVNVTLQQMRAELDKMSGQSTKISREQVAASRSLEAQYRATGAAQVAASRAAAADSAANAAKLRESAAAYTLSARMAAQAARDEKARAQASVNALDNEQRAYRNMWQARQVSDDETIAAQRRIQQQALLQAQTVDKTTDAYRRLTQVAAAAQRTVDQAQGFNTPGGFGAGITQGILQAIGNLGPFGQLLEQSIGAAMQAAEQAARDGAQDVAVEAGTGLRTGLIAQGAGIRKSAGDLAKNVQEGSEDALDIRSPSRVMHRVGQFAGEGLADGLLSKRAEVAAAAKSLANTVETNATPTISPVSGGAIGGVALPAVAVLPSAQQNLRGVATQAAVATAALGGTAIVLGAVSAGLVNGAQKAAAYEQGLAEISTLTNKLPSELGQVGTSILKMSTDVGRSFADLKAGYEEILGASVRGATTEPAALKFLERSAALAKVTRTETKVAADALTSILNAYEMDASSAAQVSDMLWASIAAGKVRLSEIAGSLGSVAGQAKSLDVPMEELLGAMALLTTRGIPASTALEYIRSALTNVQKPSKEAAGTAKELGIQFSAAALKSMGLVKFLDQLGRGVGDNSEALSALIGDVGGLNAVIGLLNGGLDDTGGILDQVTNSAGELDKQVAKLKGTAEDSVGKFNAAWERTQILFSGGLLDAFTGFLDKGINPLLIKLGDLKTAMNDVKSPGELKAILKITAEDDFTSATLKLLFQASGLAGAASGSPLGQLVNPVDPRTRAIGLARLIGTPGQQPAGPDVVLNRIQPLVGEGPCLQGSNVPWTRR
ncbi:phage tail tape measure protein [Deinococcus malanensis]|uniref:phage tail tape measure protein n=1 Tax=Deinococcus malanensis TaxID=1706855 RepID=UPI0036321B2E